LGELGVGWVLRKINGDEELLSFGVNITNIYATLVGEEDPVTLLCQDTLA